ncbi:hypothetical protein F4V91_25285 [Neorhizobium galegae]|uniref:Ubiquitin-like protease family profile domain-containing protein n=2 Tax=Neorhizobium galegae TaxID=399 RepID=A0A6A1TJ10_NEOGA|nr:hypothetical protein F4V91_25285 [Neorhizobium galegae]
MTRFSTNGEPNTAGWESEGRLTHHSRVAQTDEPGSGIAPQGRHPLGPTHWLTDDHITADYRLLDQELLGRSPDLAARTRLVNSVIAYHLRLIPECEVPGEFQRIVHNQNEDDTGDFLFLPVNDGRAADPDSGSHWSLLLVDRRNRENPVGYHYDSLGAYHRTIATEFAARLGASLRPMRMARQQNGYDCGVFMLEATRELARRLAQEPRPRHEMLHLDNLVADRQALQERLARI